MFTTSKNSAVSYLAGLTVAFIAYELFGWVPKIGNFFATKPQGETTFHHFPFTRTHKDEAHYISQLYMHPTHPARHLELMQTICNNINNPYITHLHFLQLSDTATWRNPWRHLKSSSCNVTVERYLAKVRFHPGWVDDRLSKHKWLERLTVGRALRFAQDRLAGRIVLLANLDIEFDHSLGHLLADPQISPRHAYFLSRFERDENSATSETEAPVQIGIGTQCGPKYMGSHDVVAFVPPLPNKLIKRCEGLRLGQIGLEGRLIWEFTEIAGITVTNPCKTIRTWHNHRSGERRWITPEANTDGRSAVAPPAQLPFVVGIISHSKST